MVTVALKTLIAVAFLATLSMDSHLLSHLSFVPGVRPQLNAPNWSLLYSFLFSFSFPSCLVQKNLGCLLCEKQGSGQVDPTHDDRIKLSHVNRLTQFSGQLCKAGSVL